MLDEFKKFALRGNVVDLAVGVIIGAAFGAIVTSAVQDVFMPMIGAVTGGLDFSNYYIPLSSSVQKGAAYADAKKQGAVIGYGQFITVAINFIDRRLRAVPGDPRDEPAAESEEAKPEAVAEVPADVKLLAEIRDILATTSNARDGLDDALERSGFTGGGPSRSPRIPSRAWSTASVPSSWVFSRTSRRLIWGPNSSGTTGSPRYSGTPRRW